MDIPRIALALALMVTTPAMAQNAASSSAEASMSSELATSGEPVVAAGPTDAELEMAVRVAYTAAAAFASAHGNYFARDGVIAPLHDAVAPALAQAYPALVVPAEAAADLDAAKLCRAAPGIELRLATNTYGDGITLVAVTDHRVFAYDYDPHRAAEIKVIAAADCIKTN